MAPPIAVPARAGSFQTMDYRFGVQLAPVAAGLDGVRALARLADADGLDLLGVQDHPYAADLGDTMAVIATVLAGTERLRVFPDVASLPLRGPAVLAKQAATLDLLSGGRFELALGAGALWPAIAAMGGPDRAPGEALRALEEAIDVIRAMWRQGETARAGGEHYAVRGVHAGPAPAHPVGIWIGAVGPKAPRRRRRRGRVRRLRLLAREHRRDPAAPLGPGGRPGRPGAARRLRAGRRTGQGAVQRIAPSSTVKRVLGTSAASCGVSLDGGSGSGVRHLRARWTAQGQAGSSGAGQEAIAARKAAVSGASIRHHQYFS